MSVDRTTNIGPMRDDEFDLVVALLAQALSLPLNLLRLWLGKIETTNMRVVRHQGRVVAALGIIRMGQWFGGNRIPVGGITAVGVAPEYRGSGIGEALLRTTLEELNAEGIPLSALYPATLNFYRRIGFERASTRTIYELHTDAITIRDRTLTAVEVTPADYATLRELYNQRARMSAGTLDRPEYFWYNYLEPAETTAYSYLVLRDGQPEGYVIFTQGGRDDPLTVYDVCVLTGAAGRRLLTLLADHRSIIRSIRWSGAPYDPLVFLLPEQRHSLHWTLDLLLRIVDVAGALTARGYPPGLTAELHLEIHDTLMPWNNGRRVLAVSDGQAHVHQGGQGRIRMGIRELATLYSGYLTPFELQTVGAVEATYNDLVLAGQVFAGPRPWTPDNF